MESLSFVHVRQETTFQKSRIYSTQGKIPRTTRLAAFRGNARGHHDMKHLMLIGVLFVFTCVAAAEEDENVAKLIRGLTAEKATDRKLAASELARLGPDAKPALKALVTAMRKDKDAKVRAIALYAIKQMGDEAKTVLSDVIAALEKDKNEEVRCVACDLLGQIGKEAKAGVPALAAALKDKDVGPSAAAALGKLGEEAKSAINDLVTALEEPAVRSHAAQRWAESVPPRCQR